MKARYHFLLTSLIGIVLMSSCATIYRCGETPPTDFKANKRITALVTERDSLCTTLETTQNEKYALETALADKSESLNALNKKYNQLYEESTKTADELSTELMHKSRELDDREKRINEMEAVIAKQDSITNRLNSILRDALLGFQDDELSVEVKNGKVYVSMSDKLLFKSGSATVETKGKDAIEKLGSVLEKNTDIDILIEGHTDNVPIKTAVYKDNWDLSVARATSIVRELTAGHEIDEKRITAAGRGEFMPRATNETTEGKALNRRTEIILAPKLDELMNLLGQEG